jgi:predicted nuclease with RNAse H fold
LVVLGIDLAADPAHTGIATLTVETTRVAVMVWAEKGSDDLLVDLAKRADLTGVDAPLGWPDSFVSALNLHQRGEPWPAADDPIQQRRLLSKRRTDRLVKEMTGMDPLSVAADRIAAVAMRCARLQTLWAEGWGGLEDRGGRGRLVETYPAAALKLWGLAHRRYKGKDGAEVRAGLVDSLMAAAPWLHLVDAASACRTSDHCLDAVISGLVAMATRAALTRIPETETDLELAAREGWIHLPLCSLSQLGYGLGLLAPGDPEP